MEHSGTLNGGHYVAYVRRLRGSAARWFYASDSMVRETDLKSVLAAEAYLLFYEREAPFDFAAVARRPAEAEAAGEARGSAEAAEGGEGEGSSGGDEAPSGNGHGPAAGGERAEATTPAAKAEEPATQGRGGEQGEPGEEWEPTGVSREDIIVTLEGSGAPPEYEEAEEKTGVKGVVLWASRGVEESVHGGQLR